MDAETGFSIEDKVYPEVTLDDLDTDERFILYEYSKLRQEDFLPADGETDEQHSDRVMDLIRHPGYWPAIWHCAYRRAHPDRSFDQIRAVIGKAKFVEVMSTFAVELNEEDEIPLASTSEPEKPSGSGSLESATSKEPNGSTPGTGSLTGLVRPDSGPQTTTALRSVTSSISAQEISGA